jgi:hypothetical protein
LKEILAASPPPQKELLEAILKKFDDNFVTMTLGDAYNAVGRPKHDWNEFVLAVNHLKSQGLMEGKGDGFVVLYSLTKKGHEAVSAKG